MTTTIDQLKDIGNQFADKAKKNLESDGKLMPIVILVKDGAIAGLIGVPDIPTGISKQMAYRTLADFISNKEPDAAILINDAYMRSIHRDEAESYMKSFSSGQLATDQEAKECLILSFKGPTVPAHVCCFPYERNAVGDIVFTASPVEGWHADAELNLLPDWWSV